MRLDRLYAVCLIFLLFCVSCVHEENKAQFVVGISQCAMNNDWRQLMVRDMRLEAINHPEIELRVADADRNTALQIQQIEKFIEDKVDVIIISANESAPITPVAVKAYRAGIPTIILDREIESEEYSVFIGADNYSIGRQAGAYIRTLLKNQPGEVLEIWGVRGSSAAIERHEGCRQALLMENDRITLRELDGQWEPDTVYQRVMELDDLNRIRVVFAQSDIMALAARRAIADRDSTLLRHMFFIGVDAQIGRGLGVASIMEGKLDASIFYPTGGSLAIKAASWILKGEAHAKNVVLNTALIDNTNAEPIYLQLDRFEEYQKQIERQKDTLDDLLHRYHFLRSSVLIILTLTALLIVSLIYIVAGFRKLHKSNYLLRERNRLVRQQRQELEEAKRHVEQATAEKLKFFTNVSHEVKTPLTLILGPLTKLEQDAPEGAFVDDIRIIKKNAERLRRVINQLLDFRKVEFNKMNMRVSKVEFVDFAQEVKSCFDNLAENRRVTYRFEHAMERLTLWVDTDKMEKVLSNLLSNAFKFTPEGGRILLRLEETEQEAIISVEDNGEGIPPENLKSVFERFFTSGHGYTTGTGIGLHLVREFVQMHKGQIEVESTPGQRTVFTIHIPKGKDHFDASCVFLNEAQDVLAPTVSEQDLSSIKEKLKKSYDYTILIVEDDREIRLFLERELGRIFRVVTAENGQQALELLKSDSVSLILSDVMMPVMNGYELCQQVKSDIAFSHIPVILLTALTEDSQRMYGLAKGADAYISKPFQVEIIEMRIINLLEERDRMRNALKKAIADIEPTGSKALKDTQNMDDLFMKKFIHMIEENYADAEFNIEKGSEKLGLSRVHLYRKVKELSGITPVEFLRSFRLKRAVAMLRERSYTVSEVAYSTGFGSPAYFSKCFKSAYQITPSEFVDQLPEL